MNQNEINDLLRSRPEHFLLFDPCDMIAWARTNLTPIQREEEDRSWKVLLTPNRELSPEAKAKALKVGPKMPFGKHKGKAIAKMDVGYCRWCLENLEKMSSVIREAMERRVKGGEDKTVAGQGVAGGVGGGRQP